MERRRFLHLGAAAGAAVTGGSGCGLLLGGPASATADLPNMAAFFAKLDGAMEAVANGDPLADLVGPRCPAAKRGQPSNERSADTQQTHQPFSPNDKLLVQKSLRSLLLAGAVHELPEAARHHPGMVARLNAGMGEMDEAVFGMTELLEGLSPGDRVELGRRIQQEPGLPMRVAESLDADASALQVPHERRLRLRRLASHVSWRLRNQPPENLLDEYTTKVRRLAARNGYDEEMQRKLATQASTAALFAPSAAVAGPTSRRQPADPDGPPPEPPPADTAPPPTAPPPVEPPFSSPPGPAPSSNPSPAPTAPPPRPDAYYLPSKAPADGTAEPPCEDDRGEVPMTVGGILMGVAAAMGIAGGVLAASGQIFGAFLLTGGGLLLLAGLITLIVGAVMASGEPDCS
ncbi:MAG: hypothetical protein JRI68_02100 [Deltaproteobacteria bacterium]|nr:hypothetical protein [Deltaproteobacteria bacterium]